MTRARRLTPAGIRRAKAHLDALRADPLTRFDVPDEILFDRQFAVEFKDAPLVEHRPFGTRRDAAEYIQSFDPQIGPDFVDDWPFWSWLGLFHLSDILSARQMRVPSVDEWIVVDPANSRSASMGARHYLRAGWRLADVYGERVAFLLNRDIVQHQIISQNVLDFQRHFNSVGIVDLIISLYTRNDVQRRGFTAGPGSIRHLQRVLDQLALTHDVYGMPAEALMEILPPEFDRWKT